MKKSFIAVYRLFLAFLLMTQSAGAMNQNWKEKRERERQEALQQARNLLAQNNINRERSTQSAPATQTTTPDDQLQEFRQRHHAKHLQIPHQEDNNQEQQAQDQKNTIPVIEEKTDEQSPFLTKFYNLLKNLDIKSVESLDKKDRLAKFIELLDPLAREAQDNKADLAAAVKKDSFKNQIESIHSLINALNNAIEMLVFADHKRHETNTQINYLYNLLNVVCTNLGLPEYEKVTVDHDISRDEEKARKAQEEEDAQFAQALAVQSFTPEAQLEVEEVERVQSARRHTWEEKGKDKIASEEQSETTILEEKEEKTESTGAEIIIPLDLSQEKTPKEIVNHWKSVLGNCDASKTLDELKDNEKLIKSIFKAIRNNDLKTFCSALLSGVSVNTMEPCTANDLESFNYLLHTACLYGREEMVKILIASGADLESKNIQGLTSYELVKKLLSTLKQGDRKNALQACLNILSDQKNQSTNNLSIIQILQRIMPKDYALRIKLQGIENYSKKQEISAASYLNKIPKEILTSIILRTLKANPDFKSKLTQLIDFLEKNPSLLTCKYFLLELKKMITSDKDNLKSAFSDNEKMMWAFLGGINDCQNRLACGIEEIFEDMIEHKKIDPRRLINLNAESVKKALLTIKFDNLSEEDVINIDYLISAGIQIDEKNKRGNSILHLLCLSVAENIGDFFPMTKHAGAGNSAIKNAFMRQICDLGLDVNAQNNDGNTPLHILCGNSKEELELINILLECGASMDVQNKYLETPLFVACKKALPEIVNLLIQKGCDLNGTNEAGKSVLNILEEMQTPNQGVGRGVRRHLGFGNTDKQKDRINQCIKLIKEAQEQQEKSSQNQ